MKGCHFKLPCCLVCWERRRPLRDRWGPSSGEVANAGGERLVFLTCRTRCPGQPVPDGFKVCSIMFCRKAFSMDARCTELLRLLSEVMMLVVIN